MRCFRTEPGTFSKEELVEHEPFGDPGNNGFVDVAMVAPSKVRGKVEAERAVCVQVDLSRRKKCG